MTRSDNRSSSGLTAFREMAHCIFSLYTTLEYPTQWGQIEIRVGTGRYLFDTLNGGAIL